MAIIFIPGIKGSQLVDQDNNMESLWPLPTHSPGALNKALHRLEYCPSKPNPIVASQVLPDVASPMLASLEKTWAPEPILSFAYDWRLPIVETAQALSNWLEHTFFANGIKTTPHLHFVSHSMGSLLLRTALMQTQGKRWPHHVGQVVYIAPPFQGSLGAIHALAYGDEAPIQNNLQEAYLATTRSFPATYELLPTWHDAVLINQHSIDIFNPENWLEKIAYTQNFRKQYLPMAHDLPWHQAPHRSSLHKSQSTRELVIAGMDVTTPWQIRSASKHEWLAPANVQTTHDGDGRVWLQSAALPHKALAIVRHIKDHGSICHHPKVIDTTNLWLNVAAKAGKIEPIGKIEARSDTNYPHQWNGLTDTIPSHIV